MKLVLVILALWGQSAMAADKNEIWDLLTRIDSELRLYDQQPRQLEQAKIRLEEALRILRQGSGTDPNNCLTYVTDEYVKSGFSNSAAMQKAKSFCTQLNADGTSLSVVQFFHIALKKDGYSVSASLQIASETAKGLVERDLDCIQPAFDRYRKDGYSSRVALTKSVDFCKN